VILLDTHVLVWLVGARERLSGRASKAIESGRELAISIASVQEIAYLVARGRLAMDRPLETWIGDALNVHEVRAVAPTVSTALRAGSLDPSDFHGDPVDRLIYATAVEHDAQLVSADERLRGSDPARVIW
jgi:PIN domain nuclease of toxin-antitoxin system